MSEASTGRLKGWGLALPEGSFTHILTLTVSGGLTKTVTQSTSMWRPHVARTSSQQEWMDFKDKYPESEKKQTSGNHIAFYDLALGVMQHHFCHILLMKTATKGHPAPRGGDTEPTYRWKHVVSHCNKSTWDGTYIGVAIFGKYPSRSPRNTTLCCCVGISLNLIRYWEHVNTNNLKCCPNFVMTICVVNCR